MLTVTVLSFIKSRKSSQVFCDSVTALGEHWKMMCVHPWELSMNVWMGYDEGVPHLKKILKGLFSAFCVTSHSRCSSCRPSHFSDRSSSALGPGWCKGKTGGSLLPPLQLRLNVVFLHKYIFSFPSSHFNLIEWYKIK